MHNANKIYHFSDHFQIIASEKRDILDVATHAIIDLIHVKPCISCCHRG